MQVSSLLEAVLPLQGWSVVDVEFREEERELRVRLEPSRRSALCSSCGAARRRHHDHLGERRWRTQDAFGVRTVLRARLRRVDCRQCGVRVEAVPWARPGSRYAKALEREIVEMARDASLLAVSRHFRLGWKVVYGIVKRLVTEALSRKRRSLRLSPPAFEGTNFTGITGAQGPTGGHGDSPSPGTSPCPWRACSTRRRKPGWSCIPPARAGRKGVVATSGTAFRQEGSDQMRGRTVDPGTGESGEGGPLRGRW